MLNPPVLKGTLKNPTHLTFSTLIATQCFVSNRGCYIMEKKAIFWIAITVLNLSMAIRTSRGSLFTSLQFTRDTLMTAMGYSQGPKLSASKFALKKTAQSSGGKLARKKNKGSGTFDSITGITHSLAIIDASIMRPDSGDHEKVLEGPDFQILANPNPLPTQKTFSASVPTSPSNKFLEAINEIERAVANARASGVRYSETVFTKLKDLLERAIRSKSYKYGREVLGQIMYLLSTNPSLSVRSKRSNEQEGTNFLQGLRAQLGSSAFESFMAVQGDVSLMFVIDDTGSMGEEIQATKKIAIDIINYPRQAPVEYILSPFNDPYPDEPPVVVKDNAHAGEFVTAINNLKPHGGGDCPEYTFTGMLEALYKEPQLDSPMYVFTDAGPKDATPENIEEVKYMASVEYGVTINFFTTGYCRSQGYSGKDPRNLHPAFKEIAELTSGQALLLKDHWELEKLSDLTGGVLDGTNVISLGSNLSGRQKRNVGGGGRYRIPVDESIEKMTVTVTTTRIGTKGKGITLHDPDNILITSEKVSLSQITIYQINKPKKGSWNLVLSSSNGEHEFYVKSTSKTNIDFEHYFLIPLSSRRKTTEVPISNPLIGKSNKVVITVAGSEKVDPSSVRLELITTGGTRTSDVTLQTTDNVHFTASFTPRTSQPFKLRLRGFTSGGNLFERISHQTIKPTTAVLRRKYASNDYTLPLGKTTFVHFQLCNFGGSEYFDVSVAKDRMGYLISPNVRSRHVIKGRCITISVRAKATRSTDVDKTDTVLLIAKGRTSKVVVLQAVRLFVVS
ncbi:von Willebrand factor A domain-containing protein 7-like [Stylophora pistillata]|uniref:von Willebrand factor A domain-containing protein 7-like n=1 Tax=Stylophora pistillata TaxID=50429 RepID=UPI000C04D29F|nr:von Willebrand factor A domain-containing protein 7-like [Stylophora pistillata]